MIKGLDLGITERIPVLIYFSGDEFWLAHWLSHDYCVQGYSKTIVVKDHSFQSNTKENTYKALAEATKSMVILSRHFGHYIWDNYPPAPEALHKQFAKSDYPAEKFDPKFEETIEDPALLEEVKLVWELLDIKEAIDCPFIYKYPWRNEGEEWKNPQ